MFFHTIQVTMSKTITICVLASTIWIGSGSTSSDFSCFDFSSDLCRQDEPSFEILPQVPDAEMCQQYCIIFG